MKNSHSIKMLAVLTMLAAGSAQGNMRHRTNDGCGPLEAKRWGFMVFGGAAPGLFSHRGLVHRNIPRAALSCPTEAVTIGGPNDPFCLNIYQILTSPDDASQVSCPKDPQFSTQFSNGVVHVGGEISYNACSNTQYFVDVIFNRARGKCFTIDDKNYRAPDGCDSCANDCCTLSKGTVLGETHLSHNVSNYQAYGFYAGSRYYFNRVWCDRVAFFVGLKVGMLHRKAVTSTVSVPDITIPIPGGPYLFAARQFPDSEYCVSNAISGGGQIGFDYCINDCWSILVGAEVVATSPLKVNPCLKIPSFGDPTVNGQPTPAGFGRNFPIPTSIVIGNVGCLLQFPVWLGIRWEFDWCKRDCAPCA
jgi:hypothetical protein